MIPPGAQETSWALAPPDSGQLGRTWNTVAVTDGEDGTVALVVRSESERPKLPGARRKAKSLVLSLMGSVALHLPPGVMAPEIPADSPTTAARVELGRRLYFDKRLSADGTVACATCHDPQKGLADGRPVAVGVNNRLGARNAPTVLYAGFGDVQFWDGRVRSLEEQAKQPLVNFAEMGQPSEAVVVKAIAGIRNYAPGFRDAFGSPEVTIDRIAQAIASFERTLAPFDSPFDRFLRGDPGAIDDAAKRGFVLFQGKAGCITCHRFTNASPFFTDHRFHNIGVAMPGNFERLARQAQALAAVDDSAREAELTHRPDAEALGRWLVTHEARDIGAFKTPGLRDVALTAPYMHDGSLKTLDEVMAFYNKGGEPNPNLDGAMSPLNLSKGEMSDVVEWMRSLTDESGGGNFDWAQLNELADSAQGGDRSLAAPSLGADPR